MSTSMTSVGLVEMCYPLESLIGKFLNKPLEKRRRIVGQVLHFSSIYILGLLSRDIRAIIICQSPQHFTYSA